MLQKRCHKVTYGNAGPIQIQCMRPQTSIANAYAQTKMERMSEQAEKTSAANYCWGKVWGYFSDHWQPDVGVL